MRSFQKISSCALLALSLLTPAVASASPQQAKALADIEAKGLRSVGSERLESMIASANAASDVEFTRAWLSEQPKASGGEQWRCLAEALYFMNRVKSSQFPGSLCSVINQGTGRKYQCQFTYTCDGNAEVIAEPRAYTQVGKVARAVLDGKAPSLTGGATYYHTTAVSPRWSRVFTRTTKIGVHMFYRDGVQTASN